MSAPPVIDLEALLAPISDDAPAGADPRADSSPTSLYYRVKDARNAGRAAERASLDVTAPMAEEWDTVADVAEELLASRAKDLEVAAWLTEALVRRDGFPGLRDGLKVLEGIARDYWGGSFPELDEDGPEGKLTAVAGLSGAGATGTLIQPVRLTPLTQGALASYSLWHYDQAVELDKLTDPARRQGRIDDGATSMAAFAQSVAETPAPHFREVLEAVEECLAALAAMSSAFDAVAGMDSPSISALRDLLEQVKGALRHFAADKLASAAALAENEAAAAAATEVPAGEATAAGGTATVVVRRIEGYASREDALAELTRIATYFRKSEPHSPISYTIEDAVRRARMSLPDLLMELAEDPLQIKRILLAAGIRSEEPASY